jgi:hypothetical protein
MRLKALCTIVAPKKAIAPGEIFEAPSRSEAERLIALGAAEPVAVPVTEPESK